nr:immunoglobulin heavy chain junction region [Macaca mulatta]MOW47787.1 immunoglobulin heavy chain junction region [Macaca mulatta]MOW48858.1 immunoglobulin heavy chain junction region [Macaca mulatta]MOW48873.1 immunoglobulin heavy chain junction region [Macaca mulatta]MOW49400.1 immunoglobulin heavy chain junction region [Macaca mulatta]
CVRDAFGDGLDSW